MNTHQTHNGREWRSLVHFISLLLWLEIKVKNHVLDHALHSCLTHAISQPLLHLPLSPFCLHFRQLRIGSHHTRIPVQIFFFPFSPSVNYFKQQPSLLSVYTEAWMSWAPIPSNMSILNVSSSGFLSHHVWLGRLKRGERNWLACVSLSVIRDPTLPDSVPWHVRVSGVLQKPSSERSGNTVSISPTGLKWSKNSDFEEILSKKS